MQGSAHNEVVVGELVPEVVEGGVVGVEVVVVEVFVVVVVSFIRVGPMSLSGSWCVGMKSASELS